ncbi:hypothetical protein Pelo_7901 [Pelomyxa schiedti]|nr:hypothetical protein Pelo_7901 [Pelomyxa schiedti]
MGQGATKGGMGNFEGHYVHHYSLVEGHVLFSHPQFIAFACCALRNRGWRSSAACLSRDLIESIGRNWVVPTSTVVTVALSRASPGWQYVAFGVSLTLGVTGWKYISTGEDYNSIAGWINCGVQILHGGGYSAIPSLRNVNTPGIPRRTLLCGDEKCSCFDFSSKWVAISTQPSGDIHLWKVNKEQEWGVVEPHMKILKPTGVLSFFWLRFIYDSNHLILMGYPLTGGCLTEIVIADLREQRAFTARSVLVLSPGIPAIEDRVLLPVPDSGVLRFSSPFSSRVVSQTIPLQGYHYYAMDNSHFAITATSEFFGDNPLEVYNANSLESPCFVQEIGGGHSIQGSFILEAQQNADNQLEVWLLDAPTGSLILRARLWNDTRTEPLPTAYLVSVTDSVCSS